ncbi:MAG: hypothetical protein ACF8Q5_14950 [Phycisphaerales bacterium JB040]
MTHRQVGRIRTLGAGLAMLCLGVHVLAQPGEAEREAFRLANGLTESIRDVFEGGDLRTGYAEATGALLAFAEEHEGSGAWPVLRQMVASEAANVGLHETALDAMGGGNGVPAAPEGLEVVGAVDAIVEASAGRRVVILNEAHHVGRHREMARRLLRPLREAGFTHLACEAFANSAEDGFEVNAGSLGYATRETGHYVADPFFAEAVREAVELGFELVAYETLDVRPPGGESPATRVNRRETNQAAQLAAVLEEEPEARIFVYCGYSHLTESEVDMMGEPTLWMAARLAELVGTDPLTVSQTAFYPKTSAADGVPGIAGYESDDAFVLRDEGGLWSASPERYDVELLHPRLEAVSGRPGWMFRAPDRSAVRVDLSGVELDGEACVVVTRAGEPMDAIPSDVVRVAPGQSEAVLSLRAGEYRVWLVRAGGEPELIASPGVE